MDKVDKEYYHSAEIIEFFWFFAVFIAFVVAILKHFKLKVDVHDLPQQEQISV